MARHPRQSRRSPRTADRLAARPPDGWRRGRWGFAGAAAALFSLAACSGGSGSSATSAGAASSTFTVGGTTSGLAGSGLVLQNNGADNLALSADGSFTFPTSLITGNSYNVSVLTQPSAPNQTCVVTGGSGIVASGSIDDIAVRCVDKTTATDSIGGFATGVLGSGLMLQINSGDGLAIASNGPFTFATAFPPGLPYSITVASPPIDPYQNCVIANGAGTTGGDNISNVAVSCTTNTNPAYTIAVTVSGVSAASPVMLQDNGRDTLTVSTDGTYTFKIPIPSGSIYNVTLAPSTGQQSQTCTFTNASGTVAGANVSNVSVACIANASISVNVSDLLGAGLVLQDNGADNLAISRNGTDAFPSALPTGSAYKVTVLTQPSTPAQTCTVVNGQGTVSAGSTTPVSVNCTTNGYTVGGTVSGLSGSGLALEDNAGSPFAISGTGTVPFTLPGTIASGALYAVTVSSQPVNPSQVCTVANGSGPVGGANVTSVQVTCVTQNFTIGGTLARYLAPPAGIVLANGANTLTPAADATTFTFSNPVPSGQPYSAAIETQPTGQSCQLTNGAGTVGAANVTTIQVNCTYWEWIGGSTENSNPGNYGTEGAAASTNQPGARESASTWTDAAGNFWLFGGYGFDSTGAQGLLSDLWEYKPATNEWTWINGSSTANTPNTYGTIAVPVASNAPGGRNLAVSWIDRAGNLWLFGGYGMTVNGVDGTNQGDVNDLWEYNPATNLWVWVGGANTGLAPGVYGAQGVAAAGNIPGARDSAVSWVDSSGNFWLFGGYGYAAASPDDLNDLWTYSTATGLWTWVSGSDVPAAQGVYGIEGTPAAGNVPGARQNAASWTDASGNLWLLGGEVEYFVPGTPASYLPSNDLWRYNVASGLWTYMSGSTTGLAAGVYGTEGIPAPGNAPGARQGAESWIDSAGNLWLFGGQVQNNGVISEIDDVWQYTPSSAEWTWVAGSEVPAAPGIYGTQGVPQAGTTPGARGYGVTWADPAGNLWLFGGYPYDYTDSAPAYLNDIWKFVPFNLAP